MSINNASLGPDTLQRTCCQLNHETQGLVEVKQIMYQHMQCYMSTCKSAHFVGTKTQRNTTYLVGVPVVRSCINPFSLVACQQFFLESETDGINNNVTVQGCSRLVSGGKY